MKTLFDINKNRCPRCRKFVIFKKPFDLVDPLAMYDYCEDCGLNLNPEVGFYWGAMVISYMITSVPLLVIALGLTLYYQWSVWAAIGVVLSVSVLFYFKVLRVSRTIWLYIMWNNPEFEQEKNTIEKLNDSRQKEL